VSVGGVLQAQAAGLAKTGLGGDFYGRVALSEEQFSELATGLIEKGFGTWLAAIVASQLQRAAREVPCAAGSSNACRQRPYTLQIIEIFAQYGGQLQAGGGGFPVHDAQRW